MNILLAIDDSKSSEAVAKALIAQAQPKGTELRLLHVIEPLPIAYSGGEWGYSVDWQRVMQEQRKQAEEFVQQVATKLRAAGFSVTASVEEGHPKSVIVESAAKWPADLILLGSHGRKGIDRFLLGSVSEAVARHALCSVQIVRSKTS
jgi:nucleotide-binding universal stress UspA family protein